MDKFKLLGEKEITLQLAQNLCTNISFLTLEEYTKCLKEKELHKSLQIIYEIYDKGYSVMDILDNYFTFIKTTSLLSENQKYNFCNFIRVVLVFSTCS